MLGILRKSQNKYTSFSFFFIISMHTHKERERPQANRNKVERIKAKQTKREKPTLWVSETETTAGRLAGGPDMGATNDRGGRRIEWGGLGIVWDSQADAQRVNNYNVQIV